MTLVRSAWKVCTVALAAGLVTVACGSSGTPSGAASAPGSPTPAAPSSPSASTPAASTPAASTPAASPASVLCQDVAALRASLDKLKHVTVGKGTVDEIKADLADVKAKLGAVKTELHGQWQAQVSALEDSLAKLQAAVNDLASNFSASTISNTVSALRGVAAAGSNLLAALSKQCPSASPSPST
jgi:hypothetical protein